MTYLLPKFISKPIFWLATEVISEREIEDQQVINRLYFLSSDLLKNTAKRNVFTTNGNEVRHVVGGSRKRYRASGQR